MIPIIIQASNEKCKIKDRSTIKIANQAELIFLINRIKNEVQDAQIVVAASNGKIDDIIVSQATECGVMVVRGEYNDILDRLKKAIEQVKCDFFVRVFGNYPLLDIEQLVELWRIHSQIRPEYSYNEHSRGVIWGTGCEIIESSLIIKLLDEHISNDQQITLGYYIRQNVDKYAVYRHELREKRQSLKLALETYKDYDVIVELQRNIKIVNNNGINEYLSKHPMLNKYNLEAPPREVGLDKLYLHPQKISAITTGNFDITYPISVELTLTNFCNLDCIYCSDRELRSRQGEDSVFAPEYLEKLFLDLAKGGTKGVTFEGGGEPTMYKYFDRVVKACKSAGLAAGLITNGTVKLSEVILKEFEWIRVSLDATTPEEYQNMKGINLFERVLGNIAHYSRYCGTVGVGFVVTKNNISEIEPLVMRLREIGASYIQMRPVVDCPELYPEGVDLSYLRFYQNNNFGVIVDGMHENADLGNHNLPCVANGITSIISGDGSVYLCGRLNIYDWLQPIGNIKEKSFSEIWIGEERKKQWDMVQSTTFCAENCPQCRVSKFNVLVDSLKNIKSKNFI